MCSRKIILWDEGALNHNGAIKNSTNYGQIISNKIPSTVAKKACHTVTHVTRASQVHFPMKVQTLFCRRYRIRYDQKKQYPLTANLRNIKQKYQNFCNCSYSSINQEYKKSLLFYLLVTEISSSALFSPSSSCSCFCFLLLVFTQFPNLLKYFL